MRDSPTIKNPSNSLPSALEYLHRGFSIVPLRPGEKRPLIKWNPFKERHPSEEEVQDWFHQWPDAGLSAVLGPISNLFVVDIDGPDAHNALVENLGEIPNVPMSISGSRKPDRYHLFFQHPDMATGAKYSPWHPELEFRGTGGLVTLPPSLHPSGHRYEWADGKSLEDLELTEPPPKILEALRDRERQRANFRNDLSQIPAARQRSQRIELFRASQTTRDFLIGRFKNGPQWNTRLFNAACDLCGLGIPVETAGPELLKGAAPWSESDRHQAIHTIDSAFSQLRSPAREFANNNAQSPATNSHHPGDSGRYSDSNNFFTGVKNEPQQ